MKKVPLPESVAIADDLATQLAVKFGFDDACIIDMDYFIKTLSGIKAGVRPDLIGAIITHYASKWLPDLSSDETDTGLTNFEDSPGSLMKKRFIVETLVGILPPEKDSVQCNFLLRLLRTANMVGVEQTHRDELERRISWQLDQASPKELMIPAFSHTRGTLWDVPLVLRLVKRFVDLDRATKSGLALVKVAKLVDCYLAEAAVDTNLTLSEFAELAGALPSYARATDDGLYRAIDTYLKAHPGVSKQEQKSLCRLIDSRKLSSEASFHAAQNEHLPVRVVIQVLFSEHTKLNRQFDWSGSYGRTRSPNPVLESPLSSLSKRAMKAQQTDIKKLHEDVFMLQSQFNSMQGQIERLMEKKKKGFFRWWKLGVSLFRPVSVAERIDEHEGEGAAVVEQRRLVDMKAKLVQGRTPPK